VTSFPELRNCHLCPRECGVDRYAKTGFCGAPVEIKINLAQLHHGEEPPISGSRGSGTIFLSHCNLLCVYCQNHIISHRGQGKTVSEEEFVQLMLALQAEGAHNINLVTPSHYAFQLRRAIVLAKDKGLSIPILYNSSAYDKVDTLRELQGLVDIYLPDLKYYHKVYARKYSHAAEYPEVAIAAIREMFHQVGHLSLDSNGLATRGIIVRLLILPNALAGTKQSLNLLADEFGEDLNLSLMAQYYPAGNADNFPELNRGIYAHEYKAAVDTAVGLGFTKLFVQEISSNSLWTPKFHTSEEWDALRVVRGQRI
jgi:putative pyruvate formate lyase activating enzyme